MQSAHAQAADLRAARNRSISIFAVTLTLFLLTLSLAAAAQNSVPPTARQAMTVPQFAAKLAHGASRVPHPAQPRASYARPRTRPGRGWLPQQNEIYDNGPINGTTDAWTINFGFVVSDSFTVPANGSTFTGLTFGAWTFAGDVLQSVEISITSSEFGGTTYFDNVVNFTQSGCSGNQYGYNVCTETSANFNGVALNAGNYWVNLQNAVVNDGDPLFWDENSGAGCGSDGCPSLAAQTSTGTIPSEAFTTLGTTTTTTTISNYACPGAQTGFRDVYDLQPYSAPSPVAIDGAGRLYDTLMGGGRYGAGVLYSLASRAGNWFVTSLYNFIGGSSGGSPENVIVGPQGALFGSAGGGLQNCTQGYCGVIYKATPLATPCESALCTWDVTTIYQFTSSADAAGGTATAFDSAGNLYGISSNNGAYGHGAVFELTPSQGSWTEKVLYSFTGGSDGGYPSSLVVGHDGNLYGTTYYGGNQVNCGFASSCGVVFQLVPSAGGWTENVIHAFTGNDPDGWGPYGLVTDAGGTLHGVSYCYFYPLGGCSSSGGIQVTGVLFSLSQSDGGWAFSNVYTIGRQSECDYIVNVTYHSLALGPGGNLYATEGGGDINESCGPNGCTYYEYFCGGVVTAFNNQFLVSGYADIFENLSADANGNLYGTTSTCGFGTPSRTNGMIWQYSP